MFSWRMSAARTLDVIGARLNSVVKTLTHRTAPSKYSPRILSHCELDLLLLAALGMKYGTPYSVPPLTRRRSGAIKIIINLACAAWTGGVGASGIGEMIKITLTVACMCKVLHNEFLLLKCNNKTRKIMCWVLHYYYVAMHSMMCSILPQQQFIQ